MQPDLLASPIPVAVGSHFPNQIVSYCCCDLTQKGLPLSANNSCGRGLSVFGCGYSHHHFYVPIPVPTQENSPCVFREDPSTVWEHHMPSEVHRNPLVEQTDGACSLFTAAPLVRSGCGGGKHQGGRSQLCWGSALSPCTLGAGRWQSCSQRLSRAGVGECLIEVFKFQLSKHCCPRQSKEQLPL